MKDLALYNRDENHSPVVFSDTLIPEYGTMVTFNFEGNDVYTADYYRRRINKNLNNLNIDFSLNFTNRSEREANAFLGIIESISTGITTGLNEGPLFSGEQKYLLNFTDGYRPLGDGLGPPGTASIKFPTGIYKQFSGLSVMNYDIREHEGLFDFNLNLKSNREVPFTNWSGSSILSEVGNSVVPSQLAPTWLFSAFGAQVKFPKRFDIVHWTGKLYNEDLEDENEFNNFWYARRDYAAGTSFAQNDIDDNPTAHPFATDTNPETMSGLLWSQDFSTIFTPDDQVTFSQSDKMNNLKFANSILESQNLDSNKNILEDFNLNFSNRSDKETIALIHFLEKRGNKQPFKINLPQLYKKDKYFVVNSFVHEFVYKNNNRISVNLKEVVQYRNFIHDRSELRLITEDGNELITERWTGQYTLPEGNPGTIDVIHKSDKINLERDLPVREPSGIQYNENFNKIATGHLAFELKWTNLSETGADGRRLPFQTDGGPDLDLYVIDPSGNYHNVNTLSTFDFHPGRGFDDIGLYQSGVASGTFQRGTETLFYQNQPPSGTYTFYPVLWNKIGWENIFDERQLEVGQDDGFQAYQYWSTFTVGQDSFRGNTNIISRYSGVEYVLSVKTGNFLVSSHTGYFDLWGNTSNFQRNADIFPQYADVDTTGKIFYYNY